MKIQYDHGAASLIDLLFAERQFIQTEQEYLQAQTDYWTAAFQIEQALGPGAAEVTSGGMGAAGSARGLRS